MMIRENERMKNAGATVSFPPGLDRRDTQKEILPRINVTKSFLPPLGEYVQYLERIWDSNQLTNNGPLVRELESRLKEYLGVKHLFFINNGTMALQLGIRALGLRGEIITTPFSYVATPASIIWEGCRPVFVDIDEDTLCLNPALIERAINFRTTAILATHVYGHSCDLEGIQKVAAAHGLKVIYDGAHAFGSRIDEIPLLANGDLAVCSFHATKLFHTVEGGCVVARDEETAKKVLLMRSFGHIGEEDYYCVGINGKNSEFHAAMGLTILPRVECLINRRRLISEMYDREFSSADLVFPRKSEKLDYNYAYYPVIFHSEAQLLAVREALNRNGIFPRRYFYPSLNQLPYCWGESCPVSEDISKRILCLPLYPEMDDMLIKRIARLILRQMNGR